MQSDVASLALTQFRKDWPFMASMLDGMRVKAVLGPGGGELATAPAAGAPRIVTPPSNTGVNECQKRARVCKKGELFPECILKNPRCLFCQGVQ